MSRQIDPIVKVMPVRMPAKACAQLYELYVATRAADVVQQAAQKAAQDICDQYNEKNKLYREIHDIPMDATVNLLTGEITLNDDKSGLPA